MTPEEFQDYKDERYHMLPLKSFDDYSPWVNRSETKDYQKLKTTEKTM